MLNFSFITPARVEFGQRVDRVIAEFCVNAKLSKLLLVTDKGLVNTGLLAPVITSLEHSNIAVVVFDDVEADPSDDTVINASMLAKRHGCECVIGIGGGSPMDVAKLVAILASPANQQSLEQMHGVDKIKGQRLPLLLVPTTAGTGSEVTPVAIVTTGETTKAGVVSAVLQPDIAILDPDLTLGLPAHITAATGIDAMVHAIEAYTSKIRKNPYSDMLAVKALQLLNSNIVKAVEQGDDRDARGNMLLGAMLAGQAFANAPVAGVHALAYPLGGHYHIPHGLSNALVLPHVLRFNLDAAVSQYAALGRVVCGQVACAKSEQKAAEGLVDYLEGLIAKIGLPTTLSQCGVEAHSLPLLAEDAMLQQRLLVNNPNTISKQDALEIYQLAF